MRANFEAIASKAVFGRAYTLPSGASLYTVPVNQLGPSATSDRRATRHPSPIRSSWWR